MTPARAAMIRESHSFSDAMLTLQTEYETKIADLTREIAEQQAQVISVYLRTLDNIAKGDD